MIVGWPPHVRRELPIGSICLYPGPVAVASTASNPALTHCPQKSAATNGRPAQPGTGPDSAEALLEVDGWMTCDGRALPKAQFHRLHAVIGTLYGGDDETFCLPDLRGVFIRGVDHGAGVDPNVGERHAADGTTRYGGVGSMQCDALQTHVHSYEKVVGSSIAQTGSKAYLSPEQHDTSPPTNARLSSETRPKNVALWFIIRIR